MRQSVRFAIALAGLAAASTANAAISNGDFENPDIEQSGWHAYLSNGGEDWSSHGTIGAPFGYTVFAPAGTGSYVASLHTGAVDDYQRLWQDFTVASSGMTLSALVNFFGAFSGDGYEDDGYFRVGKLSAPDVIESWTTIAAWDVRNTDNSMDWNTYSTTLGSAGTYRVEFGVRNFGDDDDAFATELRFDNVMLTAAPVPEPGEWAMMIAGLGVVAFAARRRKSA